MERNYAEALFKEAQKEGADAKKLVRNLTAHLEKVGRMKLLPGILRELSRLEARAEKLESVIEIADRKDEANAVKEAAALGLMAQHVHVNQDLIKGWRATVNGRLVDRSAKQALIRLYQNITASH